MQTYGGAGDRTLDLGIKSPQSATAPYRYLGAWPRFRARFAPLDRTTPHPHAGESPQKSPHAA